MKKIRSLPYGYLIRNGKRVIDENEASVVRRIFREYQEGASMSEIATSLTRAQFHTVKTARSGTKTTSQGS